MANFLQILQKQGIHFIHDLKQSSYFYYDSIELKKVAKQSILEFLQNSFNLQNESRERINDIFKSVIQEREIIFNPHAPKEVKKNELITCFNLFEKTPLMLESEQYSKDNKINMSFDFLDKYPNINLLLQNLIPLKNERELFLNFLSTAANLKAKIPICWAFIGSQGAGKNFLVNNILMPFYSKKHIVFLNNDNLSSNFQPPKLQVSLFTIFNEAKVYDKSGNNAISEKLKILISDDNEIKFERKGLDTEYIKVYFNTLLFSNKSLPIEIEADDRRYCVIETAPNNLLNVINMDFLEFENLVKSEVRGFWCDLINYKFSKTLAIQAFLNDTKKKIIAGTRTRQDILNKGIIFKDNMLWELLHSELLALDFEILQDFLQKFELQKINIEYENDRESTISLWFESFKNECLQDCLNGYIKNNNLRFLVAVILEYKNDKTYAKIALSMVGETKRVALDGKRLYIRELKYQGNTPDLF